MKYCVTVLITVTAAEVPSVIVAEIVTGSCGIVDVEIEVIVPHQSLNILRYDGRNGHRRGWTDGEIPKWTCRASKA